MWKKREKETKKTNILFRDGLVENREISLDELSLPFHERRKEPVNFDIL